MNTMQHTDPITKSYQSMRYVDQEPIDYIVGHLRDKAPLIGVEFGSGAGRYSLPLVKSLPHLHLTCVEADAGMLEELRLNFQTEGIQRMATVQSSLSQLKLPAAHFNVAFSFDSIHHFDLEIFLSQCERWLRPGSRLFIQTRLQEQNARSIWGKHFPGFVEKETRLLTRTRLEAGLRKHPAFRMVECREFCHQRHSSLNSLLQTLDNTRASTFRLYSPGELSEARGEFIRQLRQHYRDSDNIHWHDFNSLFVIETKR